RRQNGLGFEISAGAGSVGPWLSSARRRSLPLTICRRSSRHSNATSNSRGTAMDLGIAGRKAIGCASSRGLGRACAQALAVAGCEVVVNGRDGKTLEATVAELRKAGGKVTGVAADVATAEGQAALFAACPDPDILVNNNAGPPPRDFRELTRIVVD